MARRSLSVCVAAGLATTAIAQPQLTVTTHNERTRITLDSGAPVHATRGTVEAIEVNPLGDDWAVRWLDNGVPHYAITRSGSVLRSGIAPRLVRLHPASFDPRRGAPAPAPELTAADGAALMLVQLDIPAHPALLRQIEDAGATVSRYLPDATYVVRAPEASRAGLDAIPLVRWVGHYHPAFKVPATIAEALTIGKNVNGPVRIMLTDEQSHARVRALIEQVGGTVEIEQQRSMFMQATLNRDQLLAVIRSDDVLFVDARSEPQNDLNIVRQIGGADFIESAGGYTGAGVRGEALDNGLNTSHLDFQANPPIIHNANNAQNCHGTPVYGIVFGDGTFNSAGRGLLPDGQGIFSSYFSLGDRYAHTLDLLSPPYEAVFQTNSWGSNRTRLYTTASSELDEIIFDLDILITQSQSNASNQDSRPQAWAKNVVSVGGISHLNTLDTADDLWSGTASTGPAIDGRFKPDLAHFNDSTFATDEIGNNQYTQFGGTSGATPITAGHFGLMFQMWADGLFGNPVSGGTVFEERPHAATARAMMINSATPWPFSGSNHDKARSRQGWGRADVKQLYDRGTNRMIIDESDVIETGEVAAYIVDVAGFELDLRATLVHADPEAVPSSLMQRINDLSLRLTSPAGRVFWGNNGLLDSTISAEGGSADTVNTVENIVVPVPEIGRWTVEVIATEINEDGHVETGTTDADFALVVTGATEVSTPVVVTFVGDAPTLVEPGVTTPFEVRIAPTGAQPLGLSAELFSRTDGADPFVSSALTPLGGDRYLATLPAAQCGDVVDYYIHVVPGAGQDVILPDNAPASFFSAGVGTTTTVVSEPFATSAGWTVSSAGGTVAPWEHGVPVGGGTRNDPAFDADGNNACWLTGNGPGDTDVDGGPTTLTSSVYDLSAVPDPVISYARWFSCDDAALTGEDFMTIEVSDNAGSSWTLVETVGSTFDWRTHEFRLTDFVSATSQVQLRVMVTDNPNNSVTEGGFDSFTIRSTSCTSTCVADLAAPFGTLDFFDLLEFLALFEAEDPAADLGAPFGSFDFFDILAYLSLFDEGCP